MKMLAETPHAMQYALPTAALAMQCQIFHLFFFFVSSFLLLELKCEPCNGQYTQPAIANESGI